MNHSPSTSKNSYESDSKLLKQAQRSINERLISMLVADLKTFLSSAEQCALAGGLAGPSSLRIFLALNIGNGKLTLQSDISDKGKSISTILTTCSDWRQAAFAESSLQTTDVNSLYPTTPT